MAGWDDLVLAGQPRLIDYYFETTAGVDWKFIVGPFTDASGDAVDLSAATYVCKVTANRGGGEIVEWDVTGDADGYLTGVVGDADTGVSPRQGFWYCRGTLSGAVVQFWGPGLSPFLIYEGV